MAFGPTGGAPVANQGSSSDPLRLEPAGGSSATGDTDVGGDDGAVGIGTDLPPTTEEPQGEGVPAWPFIVGGVAIVVGVGIALGVFFGTQPTDETQISSVSVDLVSQPPVLLRFDL